MNESKCFAYIYIYIYTIDFINDHCNCGSSGSRESLGSQPIESLNFCACLKTSKVTQRTCSIAVTPPPRAPKGPSRFLR